MSDYATMLMVRCPRCSKAYGANQNIAWFKCEHCWERVPVAGHEIRIGLPSYQPIARGESS